MNEREQHPAHDPQDHEEQEPGPETNTDDGSSGTLGKPREESEGGDAVGDVIPDA